MVRCWFPRERTIERNNSPSFWLYYGSALISLHGKFFRCLASSFWLVIEYGYHNREQTASISSGQSRATLRGCSAGPFLWMNYAIHKLADRSQPLFQTYVVDLRTNLAFRRRKTADEWWTRPPQDTTPSKLSGFDAKKRVENRKNATITHDHRAELCVRAGCGCGGGRLLGRLGCCTVRSPPPPILLQRCQRAINAMRSVKFNKFQSARMPQFWEMMWRQLHCDARNLT